MPPRFSRARMLDAPRDDEQRVVALRAAESEGIAYLATRCHVFR